ncbi:MAG: hypothetical protein AB7U98_12215 [Candidatus Nitrosocosmicus sp.]
MIRALDHFVKKVDDMLTSDQSIKNSEIVKQDLINARNKMLDMIYEMSKNFYSITDFKQDNELLKMYLSLMKPI